MMSPCLALKNVCIAEQELDKQNMIAKEQQAFTEAM